MILDTKKKSENVVSSVMNPDERSPNFIFKQVRWHQHFKRQILSCILWFCTLIRSTWSNKLYKNLIQNLKALLKV